MKVPFGPSWVRSACCLLAAGWLVAATPAVAQDTGPVLVLLSAGHADIRGADVHEGRDLIAKVGDVVALAPGRHELWVWGPRRYAQRSTLVVAGGTLSVEAVAIVEPVCSDRFDTRWPPPRLLPQKQSGTAPSTRPLELRIEAPVFGAKSPLSACAMPSMLACPERKALVTPSAEPAAAEVWVNNQRKPLPSGATLSVPFCGDSGAARLLWRAAGYVNCSRQVALTPDAEVAVSCTLQPLVGKP